MSPQPLPRYASQTKLRTINLIVVHCSATPSGKRIDSGKRNAAQVIDGWHAQRGFARNAKVVASHNPHLPHIGYHHVIDVDGRIFTGRGLTEAGAHVAGHNAGSVGICLVGGAEPVAKYRQAQWDSLKALLVLLHDHLPQAHVVGHRDLSPDANGNGKVERNEWLKTCPGFDVAAWLAKGCTPPPDQVLPAPWVL